MPPIIYLVVGFCGGYWIGRRTGILAAMRREASAVIDSVARMNNLSEVEGLRLHQGNEKNGVKLLIKTRQPIDYSNLFGLPGDPGLGSAAHNYDFDNDFPR
jgi:hypothetical protein